MAPHRANASVACAHSPKRIMRPPLAPGSRSLSNSERSHLYRSRQRQHETDLARAVTGLRNELAALAQTRAQLLQKAESKRHASNTALTQLVREFHRLFRHGLQQESGSRFYARLSEQEIFLRHAIDPAVRIGSAVGIPALKEYVHHFTRSFGSLESKIETIETTGPEDDPTIVVHTVVQARIALQTFDFMFPVLPSKHQYIERFVNKTVCFVGTSRYQFSPEGRIRSIVHDADFVRAFVDAGASAADIAELMQHIVVEPSQRWQSQSGNEQEAMKTPIITAPGAAIPKALRPKMPNSVRGKRYRAQRQRFEANLLAEVDALRHYVSSLRQTRSQLSQEVPATRRRMLVEIIRRNFELFEYGLAPAKGDDSTAQLDNRSLENGAIESRLSRSKQCEAFLRETIARDGAIGDVVGAESVMAGWRTYTSAFSYLHVTVQSITIAGPENDPIVRAQATFEVVVSVDTFRVLFPLLPQDDPIVGKFMGMTLHVPLVAHFQFNSDEQIAHSTHELSHAEAFIAAGATVEEVSRLMQSTRRLGLTNDHRAPP